MANHENVPTPWGKSQGGRILTPGVTQYHTAGHGGVKVIKRLNQHVPTGLRAIDGWYEEDCDMCIPMYVHFDAIKAHMTEDGMHDFRLTPQEYFKKFDKAYFKARIEEYNVAETIYHYGTVHPDERIARHGLDVIQKRIEQIKRKERTPLPRPGDRITFDKPLRFGKDADDYRRFIYMERNVFQAIHEKYGATFLCRIRRWQERDYCVEKR